MEPDSGRPTVVIVGRPNVGKSTLFNALTGNRRSIVGDEPGITRDRIYGDAEHHGKTFTLIDTGGIIPNDDELIPSQILKQARFALEEAAQIIYVIDGRTEITGTDRELAAMLKRLGKPVTLAVNKIDHPKREDLQHEFFALGFADVMPVSAEHRRGLEELLDHVTRDFPAPDEEDAAPGAAPRPIRVAIIGRPNTGKSTLLNSLIGEERAIVSPIAGTTRDAVDETVVRNGQPYTFIDTAGIRRKGKTHEMAEKLSVMMARRNLESAHAAVVLIDAIEGPTSQDATIAGYAHEAGRPVIICVNKWDAVPKEGENAKSRKEFELDVRDQMRFLEYAPVHFISAQSGLGVKKVFDLIQTGHQSSNQRVTTGELNRFIEYLKDETDVKIRYITQASVRPPTFVLFTERKGEMHFSTERYIINQLRKRFGFAGTPIVLKLKKPGS
jgi:GTP-binding protein